MSLEGSEAPRAARVSFLAWIFEFRGRPTGGFPRLRSALVFLLRMFWFWRFWMVGARRFLLCRPTGGASLPGSRFLGSCQIVYVLLPAFLPPPVDRSCSDLDGRSAAVSPLPTNGRRIAAWLTLPWKLPNSLRFAACISSAACVSLLACAC